MARSPYATDNPFLLPEEPAKHNPFQTEHDNPFTTADVGFNPFSNHSQSPAPSTFSPPLSSHQQYKPTTHVSPAPSPYSPPPTITSTVHAHAASPLPAYHAPPPAAPPVPQFTRINQASPQPTTNPFDADLLGPEIPPSKAPSSRSTISKASQPVRTETKHSTMSHTRTISNLSSSVKNEQQDADEDVDEVPNTMPPPLPLPTLILQNLPEHQLHDFAFTILVALSRSTADFQLWSVVRSQLELEETHSEHIVQLVKRLPASSKTHADLSLILTLLEHSHLSAFPTFKAFLRFRDSSAEFLQQCMLLSLSRQSASSASSLASQHALRARFRGALRRLDSRCESDYDDSEHAAAAVYLADTVRAIGLETNVGLELPAEAKACVCRALLAATFDTIDEGQLIDESVELVSFLQRAVWPVLGISPVVHTAVYAWETFRWYVCTASQPLARKLKALLNDLRTAMTDMGGKCEVHWEDQLVHAVGQEIINWSRERLCDYYHNFSPDDLHIMQALLELFVFAAHGRGDSKDTVATMTMEMVVEAVQKEYDRRLGEKCSMRINESDELALVDAESVVREMMELEEDAYSTIITSYLPYSKEIAYLKLHSLYGQRLLPWINEDLKLGELELRAIHTALDLEPDLLDPIQKAQRAQDVPDVPGPVRRALMGLKKWSISDPLHSALAEWVAAQGDALQVWMSRQFLVENWKRASRDHGCSSSALEVVHLINATIDALVDMRLPVPPDVLISLMKAIDAGLQKYCSFITETKLLPTSRLIPPLPQVTRYKQPVVAKQEAAEAAAKAPAAMQKVFLESVPRIENSSDFGVISVDLSTDKLQVALLSLAYLRTHVGQFASSVVQKFLPPDSSLHPSDFSTPKPPNPTEQLLFDLEHALDGTARALALSIDSTCKFLATKIVFWDQRNMWLEQLWRHSVSNSRIDGIIRALNGVLADTTECMREDLKFKFVLALLKTCAVAFERVLLNGGPCRWFTLHDLPLLQQDLQQIKSLFASDGEGLPSDDIDRELLGVLHTLKVMSLHTGPLMDVIKQSKVSGSAQVQVMGSTITMEHGTLLRILARRPDRIGSKMLKSQYKMPKKL